MKTTPPSLGLLLAAAHRSVKHAASRRLRRRRLSSQQFWLLVALDEGPGSSLRELAERRRMDSPTASRIVELLVRRGLVRIEPAPGDRRRRQVLLTDRGAALARSFRPLAAEIRDAIAEGFSDAETATLRGMLLRVVANMERFESGDLAASAGRATGARSQWTAARRVAWGVPIVVAAALAGSACGSQPTQAARASAVPVVAEAAVRRTVPLELRAIGNVETVDTVTVKPQVGGAIVGVHFREGTDVKAGQLLFTIDPRPYEAALHQAEASLARDEANARNARLESERGQSLFQQGVLSREQHDALANSAEALDASVRADRAAVEAAGLDLGYCTIRSPIDGRAGSLLVQRGNVVKAIDGGPLVVINRVDPVFVSFSLPERRLPEVEAARAAGRLSVQARVAGDERRPLSGELSFLDNAVDRSTGTIRLKGTFRNPERRLWPGHFVDVRLSTGSRPDAVVVPAPALQSGQSGQYVFVVGKDLTVQTRPVVVGPEVDGAVVVEKGVEAGEQVVTDGQIRLVPGARVELKPPVAGPTPAPATGGRP